MTCTIAPGMWKSIIGYGNRNISEDMGFHEVCDMKEVYKACPNHMYFNLRTVYSYHVKLRSIIYSVGEFIFSLGETFLQ